MLKNTAWVKHNRIKITKPPFLFFKDCPQPRFLINLFFFFMIAAVISNNKTCFIQSSSYCFFQNQIKMLLHYWMYKILIVCVHVWKTLVTVISYHKIVLNFAIKDFYPIFFLKKYKIPFWDPIRIGKKVYRCILAWLSCVLIMDLMYYT